MADLQAAKAEIDKHLRIEEGERLKPYLCDAGVPTIGVGATTYLDGRKVKLSDPPITRAQMDRMLSVEIDRYMAEVLEMVDGECGTNQLVALVLCAYNIGLAGLRGSSMIRMHRGGDHAAAGRAFGLWNKARHRKTGKLEVKDYLVARRAREAALYLTPDAGMEAPVERGVQAVEGESSLAKSPISQSGAITAGMGALTLASAGEMAQQSSAIVTAVRGAVGDLAELVGIPPAGMLGLVLLAAGGVAMYWRHRQRREGWA